MVDSKGIHIEGIIGEDYTYNDFIADLKLSNLPLRKNINIGINSLGGYCNDADDMYNKLIELKDEGYTINTYNEGDCMSCATILFAAGDTRKFDFSLGNLLCHNPWSTIEGDANELRKASKLLQAEEDKYTLIYTKLGKNDMSEISKLMDEDRCLTPDEANKYKIATQTKNDNLFNPGQMAERKQYAFAALAKPAEPEVKLNENQNNNIKMRIVDFVKTLVKDLVVKNLVVTSADGVDYTVTNEDGSEDLKVGSAITVEGQPYEGQIILADDTVITVENGIVTKIEKPEEEAPVDNAEQQSEANTEGQQAEETKPEETPEENTDAIDSLRQKVDELYALFNDLSAKVDAIAGGHQEEAQAEINDLKAQIKAMASTERVNTQNQQQEPVSSFFGFGK